MKILRVLIYGSLIAITLCHDTFGQSLTDCTGINSTPGQKVVLDKLVYESDSGSIKILTGEMLLMIELISRLRNLFPDAQPQSVLCENRAPRSDGSDFVTNLVETLDNREVLLEVWGTINGSTNDNEQKLGGSIYMMIIPVRNDAGIHSKLDFHLLSYPKEQRGDLISACTKMVLGTEFDVYISIARGLKELQNSSYDDAKKYLSNARIQWERALQKNSLAMTATDQNLILGYIKDLEQRIITESRNDPGYDGDLGAVVDVLTEGRP